MFDVGWTELVVIGVVALIVIGPKDLPDMFRQLGRFTAKLRAMAREFQRAMDQAAKESGAADLVKDVKNLADPKSMGLDAVRTAADKFEKWDPLKNTIKPTVAQTSSTIKPLTPAPMPATATPVTAEAPPGVGAATQALYDKKAAKEAVLKDAAAKLKAIDTTEVAPAKKPAPAKKRAAAKPPAAPETAAAKSPRKAVQKPTSAAKTGERI